MPDPKTQFVRLLDVFLLGPLMIYIASQYRISEPQRTALLISGVLTILYNGANYISTRNVAQNENVPA